jgi:hypothetical protein
MNKRTAASGWNRIGGTESIRRKTHNSNRAC